MKLEETAGYARLMVEVEKRFPAYAEHIREKNIPFDQWWPGMVRLCEYEKRSRELTDRSQISWVHPLYLCTGH